MSDDWLSRLHASYREQSGTYRDITVIAAEMLTKMQAELDTALSAQAPPSAVGEGQVTDAMTYAALLALRDVGYHDETIDTEHMKIAIAAALSSQAPKPASAGGEPDWRHIANEYADAAAANGIQWIRNIENGCSTSETAIAEMQANMKRIRAIAAKADTEEKDRRAMGDRY